MRQINSLIIIKQDQNNKYFAMHKNKEKSTGYNHSSAKNVQPSSKIYPRNNKQVKNNIHEKQIQSRITRNHLKSAAQYDINRLDLIFKSQPREIQQKLMKLLISYNAVMQYVYIYTIQNHESDMFEVDLLLPFLNEEQKQQFIKQFLEIRRHRKSQTSQNSDLIQIKNEENEEDEDNQFNIHTKSNRKFSFGIKQGDDQFSTNYKKEEIVNKLSYQQENFDEIKDKYKSAKDQSKDKTAQFKQLNENTYIGNNKKTTKSLNFKELAEMFDHRLKTAISVINKRKGKQQINKENVEDKSFQKDLENGHSQSQNKYKQSIIDQISMGTSLSNTQNLSDSKNINNSQYNPNSISEEEQNLQNKGHQTSRRSDQERYDEIIQEKEQYQQYEPLFNNKIDLNKQNIQYNEPNRTKNITTFQDYTQKYTSIKTDKQKNKAKINYPKTFIKKNQNDKQVNKIANPNSIIKHQLTNQSPHRQIQRESINKNSNESRNRVNNRDSYHSSQKSQQYSSSKQYNRRQQNINDFFDEHKLHLQKIYSQIRGQIKQRINEAKTSNYLAIQDQQEVAAAAQKSDDDLNILILDDSQQQQEIVASQQSSDIMSNKQFQQQMIKQYKKQILVTNQSLSSEDLTRYFKYLLANAKKLFLKYLKNKRK